MQPNSEVLFRGTPLKVEPPTPSLVPQIPPRVLEQKPFPKSPIFYSITNSPRTTVSATDKDYGKFLRLCNTIKCFDETLEACIKKKKFSSGLKQIVNKFKNNHCPAHADKSNAQAKNKQEQERQVENKQAFQDQKFAEWRQNQEKLMQERKKENQVKDELKEKSVKLRNMTSGEEKLVKIVSAVLPKM
jgi:hypothetical protein